MKEKVLKLWESKQAEVHAVDEREKQSERDTMLHTVNSYTRSQCRTTHKRQDC